MWRIQRRALPARVGTSLRNPRQRRPRRRLAGHSYQIKTLGAQVTLKLEGDSPAIQKVNRQLASLAVNADDQADYFSERREYLGRNGAAYTSEITVEPTYWSSQWVTVRFYRWAAGTGARDISWGLHSWNLQTGESVDPWTWLGGDPLRWHLLDVVRWLTHWPRLKHP